MFDVESQKGAGVGVVEHTAGGRKSLSSMGTLMATREILGKHLEGRHLSLDVQLSIHTFSRSSTPGWRTGFMGHTCWCGSNGEAPMESEKFELGRKMGQGVWIWKVLEPDLSALGPGFIGVCDLADVPSLCPSQILTLCHGRNATQFYNLELVPLPHL